MYMLKQSDKIIICFPVFLPVKNKWADNLYNIKKSLFNLTILNYKSILPKDYRRISL